MRPLSLPFDHTTVTTTYIKKQNPLFLKSSWGIENYNSIKQVQFKYQKDTQMAHNKKRQLNYNTNNIQRCFNAFLGLEMIYK